MNWPDIRGWCADCDRDYLCEAIVASQARTAVEIGVYAGRMTVALAAGVRRTGGILHSVDDWTEMGAEGPGVARQFLDALTRYGLQDVVRIHAETSAEFAARWGARPVDLVWIDGSHRYEDVLADLAWWQPLAAQCYGHDWHMDDVRRAAEEYASGHGRSAHKITGTDNIWTVSGPGVVGPRLWGSSWELPPMGAAPVACSAIRHEGLR